MLVGGGSQNLSFLVPVLGTELESLILFIHTNTNLPSLILDLNVMFLVNMPTAYLPIYIPHFGLWVGCGIASRPRSKSCSIIFLTNR